MVVPWELSCFLAFSLSPLSSGSTSLWEWPMCTCGDMPSHSFRLCLQNLQMSTTRIWKCTMGDAINLEGQPWGMGWNGLAWNFLPVLRVFSKGRPQEQLAMSSGTIYSSIQGKRHNQRGRVGLPSQRHPSCLGRGNTVLNPSPLLASKRSSITVRWINKLVNKSLFTSTYKVVPY